MGILGEAKQAAVGARQELSPTTGGAPALSLRSPADVPAEPDPAGRFRRRVNPAIALREVWDAREIVRSIAERDLRARYKQTILGTAWAVVNPLVLMAVFAVVFSRVGRVAAEGVPYAVFAFIALVPWTFFSSSISVGGTSLVSNLPIVNKVYLPREVFPLAGIVVAAVDACISCVVLAAIFAITGTVPKMTSYYVPLLLVVLVTFTIGTTLLSATLLIYLRDLRYALPLVLQVGLLVTPVAYGTQFITHDRRLLVVYAALDPLVPVLDGLRRTVLLGLRPQWDLLAAGAATSVLVLAVGYWLFKRLETGIADVA